MYKKKCPVCKKMFTKEKKWRLKFVKTCGKKCGVQMTWNKVQLYWKKKKEVMHNVALTN